MLRRRSRYLAVAGALLLALGACEDKPTRLYVLSAATSKPTTTSPDGVAIGVGPVTLPKYLDRPQMVTGVTSNQLSQANFDRWGGDLNDNITRVLATNLSNLLETDRVSLYPWNDHAPLQYQVTMDVTAFEQDAGGATVLNVFWSIVNPTDGSVLLMRRSAYRDPGTTVGTGGSQATDASPPYDAVAAAMSRDLAALSRDIATAIQGLKGP